MPVEDSSLTIGKPFIVYRFFFIWLAYTYYLLVFENRTTRYENFSAIVAYIYLHFDWCVDDLFDERTLEDRPRRRKFRQFHVTGRGRDAVGLFAEYWSRSAREVDSVICSKFSPENAVSTKVYILYLLVFSQSETEHVAVHNGGGGGGRTLKKNYLNSLENLVLAFRLPPPFSPLCTSIDSSFSNTEKKQLWEVDGSLIFFSFFFFFNKIDKVSLFTWNFTVYFFFKYIFQVDFFLGVKSNFRINYHCR